jgi:hypothetical protein
MAAAEDESPQAYEARLVAFLRTRPGGSCTTASVGVHCRWAQAAGRKGAYNAFLRARPHLFQLVGLDTVQLLEAAAAPPPPPAAAAAPLGSVGGVQQRKKTPRTARDFEAALVAHLRVHGRVLLTALGAAVARPHSVELSYKTFLLQRPRTFRVEIVTGNTIFVSLCAQQQHTAPPPPPPPPQQQQHHQKQQRAPPPPPPPPRWQQPQAAGGGVSGCFVCGIRSFSSAAHRHEHEAGRPHLLRACGTLREPKLGVSLSGAATLASVPRGAPAATTLTLRNGGALHVTLLRSALLNHRADVAVYAPPGAEVPLPPGGSLTISLTHRPAQACAAAIMLVCSLRAPDGAAFSVGHELRLRCASDAADDACLQPSSAYVRPKRPPPRAAPPGAFTAATFTISPLASPDDVAAQLRYDIAALPEKAANGALGGMIAAWVPPSAPPSASNATTLRATVVMEGVPAAEAFGDAHRAALIVALRALLGGAVGGAEIVITGVTSIAASIVPGVPLGGRSQGLRLAEVIIPKALRSALDAPAGSEARGALLARLSAPLTPVNHAPRFGELLMCEEVQQQTDIRMYDMQHAALRCRGHELLLDVPGLAEARPSVLRGDKVIVTAPGDKELSYEGVVHAVELETLHLRFNPAFHARFIAGMRHHVRFTLRRTPMLLMHATLADTDGRRRLPDEVLFPAPLADEAAACAASAAVRNAPLPAPLFNRALNARQTLAVRGALFSSAGAEAADAIRAPYVIFGPPGTGKTSTVVEYVLQSLAGARRAGSGVRPNAPESRPTMLASLLGRLTLSGPPPPALLMLVCAPSNSAVDVLASRLLAGGLSPKELLRVNAYQRPFKDVPPELQACSTWSRDDNAFLLPSRRDELDGRWVVAATCSTAQKLAHLAAFTHLFTHVAVDEAGQATEPECLCAVARLLRPAAQGGARLVLAGDPKQLGPVLRSDVATRHGLGTSFLERLTERADGPHKQRAPAAAAAALPRADEYDDALGAVLVAAPPPEDDPDYPGGFHPAYVTLLTDNYRSHPALLTVPNDRFYGGALVACADVMRVSALCDWEGLTPAAQLVPGGFPLLFHGVEGEDVREGNSPSWFNPIEAAAVRDHVLSVLAHGRRAGVRADDIGVVTPYHKQALKIRQLLSKSEATKGVKVGSVEVFQGGEKTVIILSAVRSSAEHVAFDAKHALGFLCNPKRFNVAITRARALLVVVGNPGVLCRDAHWGALLRHAVRHGAYKGCALPPGFDPAGGGDGGDADAGPEALLRRVAAEEAARAAAADEDAAGRAGGEGAEARAQEEGPAWPNEG